MFKGRQQFNDVISGVARNFKRGGGGIISTFFSSVFFGRTNLKLIEKQERLLRGPGACSPGKILSKFPTLILNALLNMMHLFAHF